MEVCNTRNNYADRIWFHIKELSMRIFLYIRDIYVIPYMLQKTIIIHHTDFVTKPPRNQHLFSFKKYFIRIAKLCICIALVNIRNIYIKYSHCGPINFYMFVVQLIQSFPFYLGIILNKLFESVFNKHMQKQS